MNNYYFKNQHNNSFNNYQGRQNMRSNNRYYNSPLIDSIKVLPTQSKIINQSKNSRNKFQDRFSRANNNLNPQYSLFRSKLELQQSIQHTNQTLKRMKIQRDWMKLVNMYPTTHFQIHYKQIEQKAKVQTQMEQLTTQFYNRIQQNIQVINQVQQFQQELSKQIEDMQKKKQNLLDTVESSQMLKINLEEQIKWMMKDLEMQQSQNLYINNQLKKKIHRLRVSIKNKQQSLKQANQQIFQLYTRKNRHLQNYHKSNQKDTQTLSNKQFNKKIDHSLKQQYVGNEFLKNYAKQIVDKILKNQTLTALKVYYNKNKQNLTIRCIYSKTEGIIHTFQNINTKQQQQQFQLQQKQILIIPMEYIMSMKLYFKDKIVGICFEQRNISETNRQKYIQIGNCSPIIDYKIINFIQKQLITFSTFWKDKKIIGLSLYYKNKIFNIDNNSKQKHKVLEYYNVKKHRNYYKQKQIQNNTNV